MRVTSIPKTKIVGISNTICKLASLISHTIPDIKSCIPLGSYGCGRKSGKWETNMEIKSLSNNKRVTLLIGLRAGLGDFAGVLQVVAGFPKAVIKSVYVEVRF